MKDPIEEFEKHSDKLNEVFGAFKRMFGSKPKADPVSFLDAMRRYQDKDSDADCEKMDVGNKLNRMVAGVAGESGIVIGKNKIQNIKGIKFELLDDNGKGTGKFDNAIVRDFKCYDVEKDLYGIKWLFDDNASYDATAISGNLKAGVKNQSVNFWGKWNSGTFNGYFFSPSSDFAPGSIPGSNAKFAFDKGKKAAPSSKNKKGQKKDKKTAPAAKTTAPTAMVTPVAITSITPSPVSQTTITGKVVPQTVTSIAPQKALSQAGDTTTPKTAQKGAKKKEAIKISENKEISMVDFLYKFL